VGLPRIVSLFSGAGGLDLGFRDAGFEIAFAVDKSKWAIETHKRNFPSTVSTTQDLDKLSPTGLVDLLDPILKHHESIGVIGGPPCQGFSRANPNSVANDPRNRLPMLYLEIVEELQSRYEVEFVLFENVLGIRDAKHEVAFAGILQKLEDLGFEDQVSEYSALDFGVPQMRRRVIISAFRSRKQIDAFQPVKAVVSDLTVRAAIGGLPEPAYFSRDLLTKDIPHHPNHWTMRPLSKRFSTPTANLPGSRSFRKLAWEKPSPTVAYGHREIHVHPEGHRRLSIFEAMILQGFPSDFVLQGPLSAQVEQVSNAVPPPLALKLAEATGRALEANRTGR
jgi:DNA (cytosine-5)-methyltransferase 1